MGNDEVGQAFCNYCGGQLEILVVDRTNPFPYRCSRCERVPTSVDGPPVAPNLAKSYTVNLNPNQILPVRSPGSLADSKECSEVEMLKEVVERLDEVKRLLKLIFGDHVLINGRFKKIAP